MSTLAPDPSVFNPNTLGDPLELDSFVFTTEEFHSFNGQPSARTTTTNYVKDPNSISVVSDFHDGSGMQEYFLSGRTYQLNNSGYWYLYDNDSPAALRNITGKNTLMVARPCWSMVSSFLLGCSSCT